MFSFLLCLLILAVTVLALSVYVALTGDKDEAVSEDWQALLYGISSLMVCPMGTVTGVTPSPPLAEHSGNISTVTTLVRLNMTPFDTTILDSAMWISVTGAKLGLGGRGANANMSITVLPVSSREECSGTGCLRRYCVSISGPKSMLPQTRSLQCPVTDTKTQLLAEVKVMDQEATLPSNCYRIVYNADSTMNVTVSQGDRSLCARRLMYSTFFVMTSCAIIILAVMIFVPAGEDMKSKELL